MSWFKRSGMPSWRNWVPGVSGTNELEQMDVDELDLEARKFETNLNLEEEKLHKLDSKFQKLVEKGRKATGPKKERLKRKAKQLKREYEAKEGKWQEMLEEYTTLMAIKTAKERTDNQVESVLRDLDKGEIQAVMDDTMDTMHKRNQKTEWLKRKGTELNNVMTEVQKDFGLTEEEDQIDDLFNAGKETSQEDISLSDLTGEDETEEEDELKF